MDSVSLFFISIHDSPSTHSIHRHRHVLTSTHMYTTCTHTLAQTHSYMYRHTHACIHRHRHTYTHRHTHVHIYTHTTLHKYIYIHIGPHMNPHTHIYPCTNTHTHKNTTHVCHIDTKTHAPYTRTCTQTHTSSSRALQTKGLSPAPWFYGQILTLCKTESPPNPSPLFQPIIGAVAESWPTRLLNAPTLDKPS